MGKVQVLTKEQQIVLAEVGRNSFFEQFYFTGGTALSAYYLYHRYSEDLDFFVEKNFDAQALFTIVEIWSKKYNFTFTSEFHEVVYIFMFKFASNKILKVDFSYYPYKRIKESAIQDGIKTDSLTDIAVNKLLTVTQRTTIKDFVDLYFLLQKITLWDLIEGVRIKFNMQLEPFILASDFLKIENFDYLPRMIEPLTLEELKEFFRQKAKELGKKSIE
ncbi:MAG: nucleotidyl transferase AbiEii/AbiGii toxin family protein [Candidatus Levybacteria bacterium]|nr:nucleotidyl transferase AbiEii/AbiGii toxin family protein [Candidatus Levybacteria bacterium]